MTAGSIHSNVVFPSNRAWLSTKILNASAWKMEKGSPCYGSLGLSSTYVGATPYGIPYENVRYLGVVATSTDVGAIGEAVSWGYVSVMVNGHVSLNDALEYRLFHQYYDKASSDFFCVIAGGTNSEGSQKLIPALAVGLNYGHR